MRSTRGASGVNLERVVFANGPLPGGLGDPVRHMGTISYPKVSSFPSLIPAVTTALFLRSARSVASR